MLLILWCLCIKIIIYLLLILKIIVLMILFIGLFKKFVNFCVVLIFGVLIFFKGCIVVCLWFGL